MNFDVKKRIEEGYRISNKEYTLSIGAIGELYDNVVNNSDITRSIIDIFMLGYAQGVRATKSMMMHKR